MAVSEIKRQEKYEMKITDTTLKNGYDKVYNN